MCRILGMDTLLYQPLFLKRKGFFFLISKHKISCWKQKLLYYNVIETNAVWKTKVTLLKKNLHFLKFNYSPTSQDLSSWLAQCQMKIIIQPNVLWINTSNTLYFNYSNTVTCFSLYPLLRSTVPPVVSTQMGLHNLSCFFRFWEFAMQHDNVKEVSQASKEIPSATTMFLNLTRAGRRCFLTCYNRRLILSWGKLFSLNNNKLILILTRSTRFW